MMLMEFMSLIAFVLAGNLVQAQVPSHGSNDPKTPSADSLLYSQIVEVAGQCISTPQAVEQDYASRRRQGLFLKAGQYERQTHTLRRTYNQLMRLRGTNDPTIEARTKKLEKDIQESERQAKMWDDQTINGYQLYFKDRWEGSTGRKMKDFVPGFQIRGGQPLLNYDIMMVDALARTLVSEAGVCEQAAESHILLGKDLCEQRCSSRKSCTQPCVQQELKLGKSQKGLHYAMVISSIFDRKLLIETSKLESIRNAFGRTYRPELQTAYWEQALSRTMQYSLWNTPNYPHTARINPTLYAATCPSIPKNRGVAKYVGNEWNEYQWNLALRTAFDHYKLSTEEATELRECRANLGFQNSATCEETLRKSGHEFWGPGPFQPWLNQAAKPAGPFLFYTHSVAFHPPMREIQKIHLGPMELQPLRMLYKTISARGVEVIREGMLCRPRLWKNPRLEPHLKSHPL
jgi:hypothetical protein